MKLSILLSIFLTIALPNPAEPVLCNILKQNFNADYFDCRSRPDVNLLDLGGPGCQLTCRSKNSTCAEPENGGEVCGKLRISLGLYSLGKGVYQFCLIPDGGFLAGFFGRYCLSVRYCAARRRACGCRAVADGRPCLCRIKTVNETRTPVTNCPFSNREIGGNSAGFLTALLPNEYEIENDIALQITDADVADQFDEAYSLFLDHIAAL